MKFDPNLPISQAKTIPSDWYFSQDIYERELRTVFAKTWQVMSRTEDVSEPGSYIRTYLGSENALVLRDKAGEIRCLSNICRHRGTEIVKDTKGKLPCLNCRYHGWTYDLDGSLRKAPQFEGVEDFSPEKFSLPRFSVGIWGPYIFASQEKPHQDIGREYERISASVPAHVLKDYQFTRRVEYDLKCNWKVYVDNYLDGGYHVPSLHKALASVLDDSEYRIEPFESTVLQSAPMQAGDRGDVNNVRKGNRALYWWAYPNLMLNFYEGVYDANIVVPTGPDTCKVIFDYFFEKGSDPKWIEQSIAVAHQVQLEDIEVSESVQRGLRSTTYSQGRYSAKREAGDYLFHRLLNKDLFT